MSASRYARAEDVEVIVRRPASRAESHIVYGDLVVGLRFDGGESRFTRLSRAQAAWLAEALAEFVTPGPLPPSWEKNDAGNARRGFSDER